MCLEDRPVLEQNAAGIDIGSREIFVAVPPDRDPNPVRVFPTFTENLRELAAWLLQCGVTTAAMESTGVYWIPLYDIFVVDRPIVTSPKNQSEAIEKTSRLAGQHAIDRSNYFTRSNLLCLLHIDTARGNNWPVNLHNIVTLP